MLFNSLQSCCHCPGQPFSKENQDNEIHGPGRLTANISSRSWDTEEKEQAGIDDVLTAGEGGAPSSWMRKEEQSQEKLLRASYQFV